MSMPVQLGLSGALVLSAFAAVFDLRTGAIPNWLTLPPIILAPVAYGIWDGLGGATQAMTSAVVSGAVPCLLFARGGMGGGDVKLFAALGALTSFDIRVGLEIQIWAFACALCLGFVRLAWMGELRSTIRCIGQQAFRRVRRVGTACSPTESMEPHKLGLAVLLSTFIHCGPWVSDAWG